MASEFVAHFILYVRDQARAAQFYATVLDAPPRLDVAGMTEFELGSGIVLGLMPEDGIRRLLGPELPNPASGSGIPRAELYLRLANPDPYVRRALAAGARLLSPMQERDWGDRAAYLLDPDGHVLALAATKRPKQPPITRCSKPT